MNNSPILIDSSFLYALYSVDDRYHVQAMSFIENLGGIPVIPEIVLTEVAFLFIRDVGHYAVISFLEELGKTEVNLLHLTMIDIRRAQKIMATMPPLNSIWWMPVSWHYPNACKLLTFAPSTGVILVFFALNTVNTWN